MQVMLQKRKPYHTTQKRSSIVRNLFNCVSLVGYTLYLIRVYGARYVVYVIYVDVRLSCNQ